MSQFDDIFRKFHHPLFLYCLKFVEEEDALDVVQDVFVQFWEKGKFTLEEEHIKSFLFHAVRNKCLNLLKHQSVMHKHQTLEKNKLSRLEVQFYKSGEKSLIEQENLEKIEEAIRSLSAIHREVIELSRFEGLKNHEIAEKLHVPQRTVETRLYRALAELKKELTKNQIIILFRLFPYHAGGPIIS